jgi:hypothetical protein
MGAEWCSDDPDVSFRCAGRRYVAAVTLHGPTLSPLREARLAVQVRGEQVKIEVSDIPEPFTFDGLVKGTSVRFRATGSFEPNEVGTCVFTMPHPTGVLAHGPEPVSMEAVAVPA